METENSTPDYTTASDKIIEVQTPNSRTRFHDPNDQVEFEREKYENARQERRVQGLRPILPNSRGMR